MKKIMNKNIIIGIFIGILISTITVYAVNTYNADTISYTTDKNNEVTNVKLALDDLYLKNNDFPYVEGIWSNIAQTINYTYTVEEDSVYIADGSAVSGSMSISTTGEKLFEYKHNFGKTTIIRAKKDDTITLSGANGEFTASGYIVKIKNLDIDELIKSSYTSDNTVSSQYTATENNEKVLVIAFASGRDRSESINFTGKFRTSYYHKNNCYIATALLPKGTKVEASAYGNMWSTAQTYIFKLK